MELSEELIAKAKGTKTPEELAALAKESSIDLTEEEAKAYFEQLHPKTGELSDDELDNVAGGGCHNGGRLVVSVMHYCDEWRCKDDGSNAIYTACWYAATPAGSPHTAVHVSIVPTKKGCGSAITPLT